jgi:hypothetical protein
MEEILASIRRIISEDDKAMPKADVLDLAPAPAEPPPAPEVAAIAPPADPPPAPAPVMIDQPNVVLFDDGDDDGDDDEDYGFEPPPEDHELIALDQLDEPHPSPPPLRDEAPLPVPELPVESLLGDREAGIAATALHRLMGSMQVAPSQTLEGVVRDLLRPLLKQWLDEHLPLIVEAEVQKEIDRIRRLAR